MAGRHEKKMPDDEDEESSSGESEVSIDKENDDQDSGGSDEEDSDEEDSLDDESSEDSESDDEESESEESTDTDSESLWGDTGGTRSELTQEASEAAALAKFQKALDLMVKDKKEKATQLFKELLSEPLIAAYHVQDDCFDFDNEADERLSLMARLFIGAHKNLASLEKENSSDHYLQILSLAPQNSSIWKELSEEALEKGDLDFATFAIERSETSDSFDAALRVRFLSGNYHEVLQLIKDRYDGNLSNLHSFMKEYIRNLNHHYRIFCDTLFNEDRHYGEEQALDEVFVKESTARLEVAKQRLWERDLSIPVEEYPIIPVTITSEQPLEMVLTIFCDMFDRIESYSSIVDQRVEFTDWEDRNVYLDTIAVVNDLIDVVEVVDTLAHQAVRVAKTMKSTKEREKEAQEDSDALLLLRRSARPRNTDSDADRTQEENVYLESQCSTMPSTSKDSEMPTNSLAESLLLHYTPVIPLRDEAIKEPCRTPSPSILEKEFFNEDEFLIALRKQLMYEKMSIFEVIANSLLSLSRFCPTNGALPANLRLVCTQLYRRLNRMSSNLLDDEYMALHVLMDELGEPQGREYCLKRHMEERWPSAELALRFAWTHTKVVSNEYIRFEFLCVLRDALMFQDFLPTGKGRLYPDQVIGQIEKIERARRIASIQQLRQIEQHGEIVEILMTDIDFNSLSMEETLELLDFWLAALKSLGEHQGSVELLNRMFLLAFASSTSLETWVNAVLGALDDVDMKKIYEKDRNTLGFFMCRICSHEKYKNNWIAWKHLYRIVHASQDRDTLNYMKSLDSAKHSLPTLALEVLMKAHEVMGSESQCHQEKGAFLIFFMEEILKLISDQEVLDVLLTKSYTWLWNNLSEEISQCLFCAFGRYAKKRRAMEDHFCCADLEASPELARIAIPLAMPIPMLLSDDKDRLGHDVVELIPSRFAFLLEESDERMRVVTKFTCWLKKAVTELDENKPLSAWPCIQENELQARIWYVMALSNFRQSNHAEALKYSQLFLTSGHATYESPITASAFILLAHATVYELFQLSDEAMLLQWSWLVVPFRISLYITPKQEVVSFQIASALYQAATRMSRYIDTLSIEPWRLDRYSKMIEGMRAMSAEQYDLALSQSLPMDGSPMAEYQWICYFFLGKLHAKLENGSIIKVLDYFFEAACSCELSGFSYPAKINQKKQQNLEPLEIHYHVHAVVWKYLRDTESPEMPELMQILSYLRAFQSHKVVRNQLSLFTTHPDVHNTVYGLTVNCETEPADPVEAATLDLVKRVDVMDELYTLCQKGFELICERFPHVKAYYRLAEMAESRGHIHQAAAYLAKNLFKRKKKEENIFDSIIEITATDIDRSCSFNYHVERALRLSMMLHHKLGDLPTMLDTLYSLILLIVADDEDRILLQSQPKLCHLTLKSIKALAKKRMSSPSVSRDVKQGVFKCWELLSKNPGSLLLTSIKASLLDVIEGLYGNLDRFIAEQQALLNDPKKKQNRKRKLTSMDLAAEAEAQRLQQHQLRLATEAADAVLASVTSTPAGTSALPTVATSASSSAGTPTRPPTLPPMRAMSQDMAMHEAWKVMAMAMKAASMQ